MADWGEGVLQHPQNQEFLGSVITRVWWAEILLVSSCRTRSITGGQAPGDNRELDHRSRNKAKPGKGYSLQN